MAFVFTPERREQMADFAPGSKVRYRDMAMPAEVLSGPHKSPARDRYLIRKADGNVSLVPVTDIERVIPRVDQVAHSLAVNLYARQLGMLDVHIRMALLQAATRVLAVADDTRGQA